MHTHIGDLCRGPLRRTGALLLTAWSAVLLPAGLGAILYGIIRRLESGTWNEPLPLGLTLVLAGAVSWHLSRRLHDAARAAQVRCDEQRVLRLARQRGGRLTVLDVAAETGLRAVESEAILRDLADGGFIEIEVDDTGIMIYRFPDVVFGGAGGRRSWWSSTRSDTA